jgi:hypothetical protein
MKLRSCLYLFIFLLAINAQPKPAPLTLPEKLSAAEFTKIIQDFSEEGGEFHSDNLISNETTNLQMADQLKALHTPGGAYIGVGAEQNFNFIALTKPRIAFIVDVRRLAVVQHLIYKALFQLSPTRGEFLARLLSRPLGKTPAPNANLNDLVTYLSTAVADEKFYAANVAEIRKLIKNDFQFTLTAQENQGIDYVMGEFKTNGLDLAYKLKTGGGMRGGMFPSFKEILTQTDLHGQQSTFLARDENYNFVRELQLKNLIIPITGNFAGTKAFAAVNDYLRKNNLTIATMYTSNVEQYLFQYHVFEGFAENVKRLPTNEKSLFIRTISSRTRHPARVSGVMFTTLMQRIPLFLEDYKAEKYTTYDNLVTSNFISAEASKDVR